MQADFGSCSSHALVNAWVASRRIGPFGRLVTHLAAACGSDSTHLAASDLAAVSLLPSLAIP